MSDVRETARAVAVQCYHVPWRMRMARRPACIACVAAALQVERERCAILADDIARDMERDPQARVSNLIKGGIGALRSFAQTLREQDAAAIRRG